MVRTMQSLRSLVLLMLLSGCVTSETGGFAADTSRERALNDYIQLALGYYEADDMVRAKRHVDNALGIDRRSSEAHHVRALIHQREAEMELARETFERSLSLDRSNSRARNNFAAFLFSRGEFEEAYRQLRIVSEDTDYTARPMAFQNLGLAALQLNREEDAVIAFERALLLDRNMFRSSLELARIHFDRGEFSEARRLYEQYLSSAGFLGVPQTARSLWLGYQIETRFDNREQAGLYADELAARFPASAEHQRYRESRQSGG